MKTIESLRAEIEALAEVPPWLHQAIFATTAASGEITRDESEVIWRRWLHGQWKAGFDMLPQVAHSPEQAYVLIKHLEGIAQTLAQCADPGYGQYDLVADTMLKIHGEIMRLGNELGSLEDLLAQEVSGGVQ